MVAYKQACEIFGMFLGSFVVVVECFFMIGVTLGNLGFITLLLEILEIRIDFNLSFSF